MLSRFRALTSAPAGAAYLDDFVPDLTVIPAQNTRNFIDREPAHEHVAQFVQFRVRASFAVFSAD